MMTVPSPLGSFSPEQHELWACVLELWTLSAKRDTEAIRARLHPDYVGWDMSTPAPHDRDAAVHSAAGDMPDVREYQLHPLSVQVYEGRVGVVHYSYSAVVVPHGKRPVGINGKWSEIYLKQDGVWTMISVSGRPDAPSAEV